MNFWDKLFASKKWILGLSPMDGVTDVAMRYMTAKYSSIPVSQYPSGEQEDGKTGEPENQFDGVDVLFTEFVNVDALHYATGERRERLMKTLMRAQDVAKYNSRSSGSSKGSGEQELQNCKTGLLHDSNMIWPYEIAQVFGKNPELFAEAASLIEQLGFDGIDINMGCPAHAVAENGCGAGLIRTPTLAQEIIKTVQKTTKLPVSVKTRIGVVDKSEMEEWIEALMEVHPAVISLHGRTLKQMYTGSADWEVIGRAAEIVHRRGGKMLGNGDVKTVHSTQYMVHGYELSAEEVVEKYGVDGVLIGRAAEGNPAIFKYSSGEQENWKTGEPENSMREQRLAWAVEHARVFEQVWQCSSGSSKSSGEQELQNCKTGPLHDSKSFLPMRKHLAWYCKGFEGAVELRMKLMQTNSAREVEEMISSYLG